ncbi:hypothetical protein HET73_03595 [Wolbachia endosymbiont of Atemnus politus]|uniref:hypothetical protein n=1 Tax=Wolbachia endosymbiont of Atemnus politus TaxID=2682840 RepID=UPI001574AF6C|nr:hypothetical protein [Wolbachia endosymbiont of Atemnus politus]NSM56577.1 hypothetical protein [Wolbachia endosymbiont of Atemnus politus]
MTRKGLPDDTELDDKKGLSFQPGSHNRFGKTTIKIYALLPVSRAWMTGGTSLDLNPIEKFWFAMQ